MLRKMSELQKKLELWLKRKLSLIFYSVEEMEFNKLLMYLVVLLLLILLLYSNNMIVLIS